jgi:hypothetical protein
MKSNFDFMMRYFHGTDKEVLAEIVRQRMRVQAEKDDVENNRRRVAIELIRKKNGAATTIQKWFRRYRKAYPVTTDDDDDNMDYIGVIFK